MIQFGLGFLFGAFIASVYWGNKFYAMSARVERLESLTKV